MTKRMLISNIVATVLVVALVVTAVTAAVRHAAPQQTTEDRLSVTASYYPLYEFAKQVGGDDVEVSVITPPGAEPHEYEPAPPTLAAAQRSKVFIYNGAHMEPWVDSFLSDYSNTAVRASSGIALQTVTDDVNGGTTVSDPHFWLDPVLAQQIVTTIRDGLSTADPAHAAVYAHNAAVYVGQLKTLDAAFRSGLAVCRTRTIVTSHAAFGYLARRYNLEVLSIAGLSPEEEPSPAQLAQLSSIVTEKGIGYIFFERLASSRLADTIASETGAKTVVFDPLEGLSETDQKQGKNYVSVQRQNLSSLRVALACQ